MPLQTALNLYPTKSQQGKQFTTSSFRQQLNASNDLIWDQTYEAKFGTIVGYNPATSKWERANTVAVTPLLAMVIYDSRIIDKSGYRQKDPLNLEVIGDRILQTIPSITIKEYDPIFVYVTGVNQGLVSNVADATPANTRKLPGYFMESKIPTDITCPAFLNLVPLGV